MPERRSGHFSTTWFPLIIQTLAIVIPIMGSIGYYILATDRRLTVLEQCRTEQVEINRKRDSDIQNLIMITNRLHSGLGNLQIEVRQPPRIAR